MWHRERKKKVTKHQEGFRRKTLLIETEKKDEQKKGGINL